MAVVGQAALLITVVVGLVLNFFVGSAMSWTIWGFVIGGAVVGIIGRAVYTIASGGLHK